MKQDVLDAIHLRGPKKIPHKESVSNAELFLRTSGLDPYEHFEQAFVETMKKLGIDFFGGVPRDEDARRPPLDRGEIRKDGRKTIITSPMGVSPTGFVTDYGFHSADDVLAYDPLRDDPLDDTRLIQFYQQFMGRNQGLMGDWAQPYNLYYTTLFMWPVQTFGWDLFMTAAMEDPDRFDAILEGFKVQSIQHVKAWSTLDLDFIMLHDDIALATGPVFAPKWYHQHIFPRYPEIFAPMKAQGKKVIYTADGCIDVFLDDLLATGVDGFMVETPATNFDNLIRKCGRDKVIIGGIDTRILTFSTPNEVYDHTREILLKGRDCPGFFLSSPGGIYGNVPYDNLTAYFAAKEKYGFR